MRKTIAILELYAHEEVLRHYCDLLKDSNYNIKIYCSPEVYKGMSTVWESDNFSWEVKNAGQSISDFLDSHGKIICAADLVLICTALNQFKAFHTLATHSNVALVVHNVHSFLDPEQHIKLSSREPLKDRLRLLKIYGNRSHFYKAALLKELRALIFPSAPILNYVQNNFNIPKKVRLSAQPFSYHHPKLRKLGDFIKIAIPGTVNPNQRDYESVLAAFKKIQNKIKHPIQIVLLGKPVDQGIDIAQAFKNLENRNIAVTIYQDHITHPEYEANLLTSTFLILPLRRYVRNYIYREEMGISKISGSINDMIRRGIPALIPDHFPIEEDLKDIAESYAVERLSQKLLDWIKHPDEINTPERAHKLTKFRSRNVIQKHFIELVENLMTKD